MIKPKEDKGNGNVRKEKLKISFPMYSDHSFISINITLKEFKNFQVH